MIRMFASHVCWSGLLVALTFSAGGCAQVLGIEDTTQATGDAGSDAPVVPAAWACVGNEPPLSDAPNSVTITANIADFLTQKPVPGLSLKVCLSGTDPNCQDSVGPFTSDAQGVAKVQIPVGAKGFDGYLLVTGNVQVADEGGMHSEPIIPYLWYFSRAVVSDGTYPLATFSTTGFNVILGALGATPDPARGHLSVEATDCSDQPAAGVKLDASTADASSTGFYVIDQLPSAQATRTKDGIAGYLNLPAQITTITTTPDAIGKPDAQRSVFIKPGALTTIRLSPNL